MDFITNPLVVEHLGHSYNCIYTVVDRLTKLIQIFPCFIGDDKLTATEVAQHFFTYIIRLFGILNLLDMIGSPDLSQSSGVTNGKFLEI